MSAASKRILVIGGGITGLSTAHYLLKFGVPASRICVVEASNRLGGWLRSDFVRSPHTGEQYLFERGPRSLLHRRNWLTIQMIQELEMVGKWGRNDVGEDVLYGGDLLLADSESAKRYLWKDQRLQMVPTNLRTFLATPWARSALWELLCELLTASKKQLQDMEDLSIHDFFMQRLGPNTAAIIDPVTAGIYSGNTRELSMRQCFPQVFFPAREKGSILGGNVRGKGDPDFNSFGRQVLSKHVDKKLFDVLQKHLMYTFRQGVEQLPTRLAQTLQEAGVEIRVGSPVHAVSPMQSAEPGGGVQVSSENPSYKDEEFDHVISTVSAPALTSILDQSRQHSGGVVDTLHSIPYASLQLVQLGYSTNEVHSKRGFGVLTPSTEGEDFLGITFDSDSFPQHTPEDHKQTRFTVMIGGGRQPHLATGDVEPLHIRDIALRAMAKVVGVSEEPDVIDTFLARNCIPQYQVGHHRLVHALQDQVDEAFHGKLHVIGTLVGGVSVNDCIINAFKTARTITGHSKEDIF